MIRNKNLTDNPSVSVFHWLKHLPKDYVLDRNLTQETSNEEYLSSIYFHRTEDQRVAQVNVYTTCIEVRIYYVEPFPHGVYQNIDWNDTTFLELTKNAGKSNVFEVCKILQQKGYEYKKISYATRNKI